jgi:hypothetical protein
MATDSIPEEHRFFIARADWRQTEPYKHTSPLTPSMWAWELLRRNNQYAQDYADWYHRVRDVPPLPFPKMHLDGYVCYPEPSPGITYTEHKAEHPDHFVLPIKDHIRERWGITRLIDPALSALDVADHFVSHDQDNKLAWLFACNTPDILNPPTIWPTKNYLSHYSVSILTSGFRTGTDVMVRLDFTGNFEAQIESLRRQIGAFFDGGTRSGSTIIGQQEFVSTDTTGQQADSSVLETENLQPLSSVAPSYITRHLAKKERTAPRLEP